MQRAIRCQKVLRIIEPRWLEGFAATPYNPVSHQSDRRQIPKLSNDCLSFARNPPEPNLSADSIVHWVAQKHPRACSFSYLRSVMSRSDDWKEFHELAGCNN